MAILEHRNLPDVKEKIVDRITRLALPQVSTRSIVPLLRSGSIASVPIAIVVASRLALAFLLGVDQILLPLSPAAGKWHAFPNALLLDPWVRWDSGWYLLAARKGYSYVNGRADLIPPVLPLFPSLTRLLSTTGLDLPACALIIANASLLVSAILTFGMVRERFGDAVASRTIVFLCVSPFSFYLSAAYPDSLVLLLLAWMLRLSDRGRLVLASIPATLAALASPVGVAGWLYLIAGSIWRRRAIAPFQLLSLGLPPLGIVAFIAYLKFVVGLPLVAIRSTLVGPDSANLIDAIRVLARPPTSVADSGIFLVIILAILSGGALFIHLAQRRAVSPEVTALGFAIIVVGAVCGVGSLLHGLAIDLPLFLGVALAVPAELVESAVVIFSAFALAWFVSLYGGWYSIAAINHPIEPSRLVLRQAFLGSDLVRQPLGLQFDDQLEIVGYDLPARQVEPGGTLEVSLISARLRSVGRDFMISARLVDRSQKTWLQYDQTLVGPSEVWHSPTGDLEQYRLSLPTDPSMPSGAYALDVFLFDRTTLESLPLRRDGSVDPQTAQLGHVLIARPVDVTDPAHARPANPLNALVGNEIGLLGFDLSPDNPKPGDTVTVVLYWHARSVPLYDYTIFVQAVGPAGLVAQSDSFPLGGRLPFTQVSIDSVIRDPHTLVIPPGVSPGKLTLIAGLYRSDTLGRLSVRPATGGSEVDHIVLRELPVAGGP